MSAYRRGKSWAVLIDLGRGPDAKRRRHYEGGFPTKREARKAEAELRARLHRGTFVDRSKVTVGEWLEEWLQTRRDQVEPTTWQSYAGNVRNHLVPALGECRLQDLTAAELDGFYRQWQQSMVEDVLHLLDLVRAAEGGIRAFEHGFPGFQQRDDHGKARRIETHRDLLAAFRPWLGVRRACGGFMLRAIGVYLGTNRRASRLDKEDPVARAAEIIAGTALINADAEATIWRVFCSERWGLIGRIIVGVS